MKPPLPHGESAVPRTLHAQLEIAKAMRTLMAPDEDELLRRRRAEIAAIRGELKAIKRDFQKAGEECLALAKAELRATLAKKYNPDQPRVSAGNRDGGQWTSGSKAGSDAAGVAGEVSEPRVRYAALENPPVRTDAEAMGRSGGTIDTAAQDTQVMHNLPNVLLTVLSSEPRHLIWSSEIAEDHPRHPVPFVESDGMPVLDNLGNRILRPDDLPPERYLRAGLANQSLGTAVSGYARQIEEGGAAAEGVSPAGPLVAALLPVSPGGVLDAERFDWNYVRDYRHYLNIMIGVYAAAAGLNQSHVLSTIDDYASDKSKFDADEPLDEVYSHSAKQDVEDTKLGYKLYESGRIRLKR
jgi:hypothetical protein